MNYSSMGALLLIFMVPEENSTELNHLFSGHFVTHPAGAGDRLRMLTHAQCSAQPDDGSVSPAAFSAVFFMFIGQFCRGMSYLGV